MIDADLLAMGTDYDALNPCIIWSDKLKL
jgi:hypothetical protein